jgi:ribosome assembly protein YihI (activator of Der GTPase)
MASRNDGKDFTMASKDSTTKAHEKESNKKSQGQKTGTERGEATNQKKNQNQAKRPPQGGSSR